MLKSSTGPATGEDARGLNRIARPYLGQPIVDGPIRNGITQRRDSDRTATHRCDHGIKGLPVSSSSAEMCNIDQI
jgi:hypothetical protein